jgi:DNA topoisomerase-3
VFDNSKVTDHHAIIPTGQRPNNLTDLERKVFDMVALRFIAAFYPPCQVANTTVLAQAGEVPFKVTGREILEQGWREVFATPIANSSQSERPIGGTPSENESDTEPSEQKVLPSFRKGESGPHEPLLQEKTTTPPKYYTEATLLRAMETAGKTVDNEELRDAMKENGIGRPSTRAAIIEKLFQRKYIVREKKNIKATELGINLIHTIISPLLKSAELTGLWEKKLREIERGDFPAQQFLEELKQMTSEVVREVKSDKSGMRCPVCGKGIIIRGRTRYGCSRWREGCTYAEQF